MQLDDGSYIINPQQRPWLKNPATGDAMKILHVDESHGQVVMIQRFGQNSIHPKHTHHCSVVAFTLSGEWAYDGSSIGLGHVAFEPIGSTHQPMTMNNNKSDVLLVFTSQTGRFLEVFLENGGSFEMDMAFFKQVYAMTEEQYEAAIQGQN